MTNTSSPRRSTGNDTGTAPPKPSRTLSDLSSSMKAALGPPALPADSSRVGSRSSFAKGLLDHSRNAKVVADLEKARLRSDMGLQMQRRWKVGDVYAPHDLSVQEMAQWKKFAARPPRQDAFDVLALDPMKEYKVRVLVIRIGCFDALADDCGEQFAYLFLMT